MESIGGKSTFLCLMAMVLYATFAGSGVHAQDGTLEVQYQGVTYRAIPARAGFRYDVKIMDPREAIEKMKETVDFFEKKSSFNAAALSRLKKSGDVTITYDPDFTYIDSRSGAALAVFASNPVTEQTIGMKQFPVILTRYVIYWEVSELAAILVHELVGHGIQHLKGRLHKLIRFDVECEAFLYQEQFYQDLGVNKRLGKAVEFRRSLHDRWCVPFRKYMEANMPSKAELWYTLNPDVPQLISIFDKYAQTDFGKAWMSRLPEPVAPKQSSTSTPLAEKKKALQASYLDGAISAAEYTKRRRLLMDE